MVEREYTLIGCDPICLHRGTDTIDYEARTHPITLQEYTVKQITPVCAKSESRCQYRKEIYDRADNAKSKVFDKGGSNKKAHNAWNKVADEYRNHSCPYFE